MDKPVVNANRNAGIPSRQVTATRTLLNSGVAAGPVFLLIFVIQILVRPEFRFARSQPSILSIGPLGWIQLTNLVLGGLLVFAGALGIRRVLRESKGGFWGRLLLEVFGIGQVGVGIFVVDPVRSPTNMTLHGTMHIVCGAISFVALMAACFVFVRTFFFRKQKAWAMFCTMTGLMFLIGFLSAARTGQDSTTSIQLFLNLLFSLGWIWVSSISAQVLSSIPTSRPN
jgi:hypothetical membrane protein